MSDSSAMEEWVRNLVDDLYATQTIKERDESDTGERLTLAELAETLGLDDVL